MLKSDNNLEENAVKSCYEVPVLNISFCKAIPITARRSFHCICKFLIHGKMKINAKVDLVLN
jgi:hypothetical protein